MAMMIVGFIALAGMAVYLPAVGVGIITSPRGVVGLLPPMKNSVSFPYPTCKQVIKMPHHETLNAALHKYHADFNLENLRSAYLEYTSHKPDEKDWIDLQEEIKNLIRGFDSFSIFPSNSYKRHMAVLGNESDLSATQSDWEAVGEYLSFGLAQHIIEERELHESKEK